MRDGRFRLEGGRRMAGREVESPHRGFRGQPREGLWPVGLILEALQRFS